MAHLYLKLCTGCSIEKTNKTLRKALFHVSGAVLFCIIDTLACLLPSTVDIGSFVCTLFVVIRKVQPFVILAVILTAVRGIYQVASFLLVQVEFPEGVRSGERVN